ncbi:MAG: DNA integrity scanning diadenylate cyclase DisA [Bifidobacteriaceae bacterium]|jgi:diadenylate cyclase|nr:DNA integrity scanning diadenylate cyclase DisA [Bifidobacteriaceae bacterium]
MMPSPNPGAVPVGDTTDLLRATLEAVAPGTELRGALERIARGRTGGLIVLGFDPVVDSICSGGFELDVPFSATRLRELSKMDGAVVLDFERGRIVRAAVQLLPDPSIPTSESGTRHRTAERVAKQTGHPVISVSQSMNIAALYVHGIRHVLLDPEELAARASQALVTLERYRARLEDVAANLTALEVEDLTTARQVAEVAGSQEMVWRIGQEIADVLTELGTAGRLLRMQFDQAISGIEQERSLLMRDYVVHTPKGAGPAGDAADAAPAQVAHQGTTDAPTTGERTASAAGERAASAAGERTASAAGEETAPTSGDQTPTTPTTPTTPDDAVARALAALAALEANALIEPEKVALELGLIDSPTAIETRVRPRGHRLLSAVPGLDGPTAEAIIARFGSLQDILGAGLEDLRTASGLDRQRARTIREGLSRIAETATLERFV